MTEEAPKDRHTGDHQEKQMMFVNGDNCALVVVVDEHGKVSVSSGLGYNNRQIALILETLVDIARERADHAHEPPLPPGYDKPERFRMD